MTPPPTLKGPASRRKVIPAGTVMGRRRALVLVVIHLAIGAHILHWLLSGSTLTPLEPSEAIAFSRQGLVNAGTLLLGLAIVATTVFGRFFCGWTCHLLAMQDGCRWLLARAGLAPRPQHSVVLAWFPLLAFVYMFLWPLAGRLLAPDPPAGRWDLMTGSFWATFPGWTLGILTFVLCGALIVWFLGSKGFCTYACPYGAAFTAVDRLSPLRIRVSPSCAGCAVCTSVCTSGVDVSREVKAHGMVVSAGCMKTLDCVAACPNKALRLDWGRPALGLKAATPADRRSGRTRLLEEALLLGLAVAGFFILRGLYGKVSFLLALGSCVMVAFAGLLVLRLARAYHLRLQTLTLKREGRITTAGRWALALVLVLGGLLAHSAHVQWQSWQAIRALDRASQAQGDTGERELARAADHARAAVAAGFFADHRMEILLARVAQRGRDTALAERHYRRALEAEPRSHALQAEFGEFLVARGQQDEGWLLLEKALAGAPDLERARQGVGLHMLEQGRTREALALFADGERRDPADPAWPAHRGNALAALDDPDGAEAAWNRALEIQPGYRPALRRLAESAAQRGRFEETLDRVDELLRDTPTDGRLHELAARAAQAAGQPERARRHLDLALRFLPADPGLLELQRRLGPATP